MTVPTHDERTVYGTDPDPGEIETENVPLAGSDGLPESQPTGTCEVCGDHTRVTLSTDSHELGPNLWVCAGCQA